MTRPTASHITTLTSILLLLISAACGGGRSTDVIEDFTDTVYTPKYAKRFAITRIPGHKSSLLTVSNPWQGADSVDTHLLILRGGEKAPAGYTGKTIDGDARRIVAMSSTYVAMLDAFGRTDDICAVSGIGFINNPRIQARRDALPDVGGESQIDYETLLSADPDLVLLYGIGAANPAEAKLDELGIPYIYIGDYLEESPLGKAEWMVALGEITGHREEAEKAFAPIPARYAKLKELVGNAEGRPKVMLNVPYGDSWFMPPRGSYMVHLIEDAGGEYLYSENTGNSSVPIDMEQAYLLTSKADRWVNAGNFRNLDELKQAYPKFADTRAVASGEVYASDARSTAKGGNDFFESGVVRPDIVLRDLIKIIHPELSEDSTFVYYRKL